MKNFNTVFASIFLILLTGQSGSIYANDWIYHAKEGDTFWDLCLKYTNKRGCWLELGKYNGVSNDRAIPLDKEIRIPIEWLAAPPVVGQVKSLFGVVSYQLTGSATATDLREGQDLHLGARLISGVGSARLEFGRGNEVLLRANSILDLDTMSGPAGDRQTAELGLPTGAVEVKVQPNRKSRFRITTPAAIAAVRGTEYRVDSLGTTGESMRSEVLSGAVEVASGKAAVGVSAGYGVATAKGESPGKPRELLPAPKFTADYSSVTQPVVIRWVTDPGAVEWTLDLMEESPSGALLQNHRPREPQLRFENLAEGCYRIKLRAVDAEGFNGLDSETLLCIVPRLAAVEQLNEISNDSVTNTMKLDWSTVAGAERYRIEVAADPEFLKIEDTLVTDATEIQFKRSAESVFYVRVIAIDSSGNESPSSAAREFKPHHGPHWVLLGIVLTWLVLVL